MRIAFIGDSFTEGVGDELPDGSLRGWPQRVVTGLACFVSMQQTPTPTLRFMPDSVGAQLLAKTTPEVFYANLAIRGRLLADIAVNQLQAALALTPPPDLIVLNGGGNDMLRPGFSASEMVNLLRFAFDSSIAAGVPLVLVSGPDPSDHLPAGKRIRANGDAYLELVTTLLTDYPQIHTAFTWSDTEIRDRRYWSRDRLHLNPLGHQRVAALILAGLGVPPDFPAARQPDPGPSVPAPGTWQQAQFYSRFVLPWIARRLTGKSSGDNRQPPHPNWALIEVTSPPQLP